MIEAWAIKAPDGRLLMRYIGPHPHLLEQEFRTCNKQTKWSWGYKCVRVEIKEKGVHEDDERGTRQLSR